MYNSLYTLVRDTAVLRDYTHCCLMIMQVGWGQGGEVGGI